MFLGVYEHQVYNISFIFRVEPWNELRLLYLIRPLIFKLPPVVFDPFSAVGNVLFYCVSSGHVSMFSKFLDLGVQIEADLDGMTLLMEAAFEGHLSTVTYLVNNARHLRICLNQQDNASRSALFYALESSQIPVVNYLLSKGAKPTTADHNKTILMCACLKNNPTVVKYCLQNMSTLGLTHSDLDNKGRNALFYAVTGGNIDILKQLMDSGAKVQASPDGINLLMQAAGKKQLDIGRLVLFNHRHRVSQTSIWDLLLLKWLFVSIDFP